MIADTSGLLALFSDREPAHAAVAAIVGQEHDALVVSPFVLAELDSLLATRSGTDAELAVLEELSSGAYELAAFSADDLREMHGVIERYGDQQIGLADASLVVLAQRHKTRRILTLDRRHFEVLKSQSGEHFEILP